MNLLYLLNVLKSSGALSNRTLVLTITNESSVTDLIKRSFPDIQPHHFTIDGVEGSKMFFEVKIDPDNIPVEFEETEFVNTIVSIDEDRILVTESYNNLIGTLGLAYSPSYGQVHHFVIGSGNSEKFEERIKYITRMDMVRGSILETGDKPLVGIVGHGSPSGELKRLAIASGKTPMMLIVDEPDIFKDFNGDQSTSIPTNGVDILKSFREEFHHKQEQRDRSMQKSHSPYFNGKGYGGTKSKASNKNIRKSGRGR